MIFSSYKCMSHGYKNQHSCLLALPFFFLTLASVNADTGYCYFEKDAINYQELHNCKNGDSAFFRSHIEYAKFRETRELNLSLDGNSKERFIARFCNLEKKIIQGVEDQGEYGLVNFVICVFQQKVERDYD